MDNITYAQPFDIFSMVPTEKIPDLFLNRFWRREPPQLDLSKESYQKLAQVSYDTNSAPNQLESRLTTWTAAMYYQAAFSELIELIKSYQKLTKITPQQLGDTDPYVTKGTIEKVTNWRDKVHHSPFGSQAIFNDLYALAQALSQSTGFPLGYLNGYCTLSLLVASSHVPYLLAKTGSCCSAFDMLKAAFPKLKVMSTPELKTKYEAYALLACVDDVYGRPGFFAYEEPCQLPSADETKGMKSAPCELKLPPHKLVINNPEQIAVLTGI